MGMTTWDHRGFCPNCDQYTDQQSYNDNDDTGNHTSCLVCECDVHEWFLITVFELAFGDNADQKNYSQKEVIEKLKEFSDNALKWENQN